MSDPVSRLKAMDAELHAIIASLEAPERPASTERLQAPTGLPEIIATFGDLQRYVRSDGSVSPDWEAEQIVRVELPFPIPLSWDASQQATRLACHRKIAPVFLDVLRQIQRDGHRDLVQSYGGAYHFRPQRGSAKLSTHSWGIAIDLNTRTNPLGSKGDMPEALIRIFEDHGFYWGGRFSRPDPMHFQFAKGY